MSRIRGKAILMSQEAYDEVRRQANENGRTLGRQIDMIILGKIIKKEPEPEPEPSSISPAV